jgi:3-oxoadipate enol-lactonase/4-carboxymuconolactone decarboxylase
MDARGHGASDAPAGDYSLARLAGDALAVMDAAGVERASVCGLSLGGMVAMELALAAPDRVERLVLACTSARMDAQAWTERTQAVRQGGTAAITEAAMGRFFSAPFQRRHPEVVDGVRRGLEGMSADGYAGCAAAIRDMALTDRIGAINAPTLVLHGRHDVSTPFAGHADEILRRLPQARSVELDAAHLACLEAPGAFAAAVLDFDGERGAELDAADALYETGLAIRREVLGDAWVDRSLAGRTAFNADFQAMITRIAWREVWGRPGLDHRTRRLLVVAITAALGRWEEFRLHVRAGLERGGFTEDELKETLMQTAIYAGVPAANTAFAEAAAVIASLTPQGG